MNAGPMADAEGLFLREWLLESPHGRRFLAYVKANPRDYKAEAAIEKARRRRLREFMYGRDAARARLAFLVGRLETK